MPRRFKSEPFLDYCETTETRKHLHTMYEEDK